MQRSTISRSLIGLVLGATVGAVLLPIPSATAGPVVAQSSDGLNHPNVAPAGPVRSSAGTVALGTAAAPEAGVREVHTANPVSMIGVRWSGAAPDAMSARHRKADGTWSDWVSLDVSDAPNGRSATTSEPVWTGPTRYVQVRASRAGAPVTDALDLVTVDPGSSPADAKLSGAKATLSAQALPGRPTVVTRAQWGADESIMTWPPEHASTTKAVAIHHTDGTNDYTCDQSAAIVRGIYRFHAITNGWGDIGYNVLVDKCGTIFEGRTGGLSVPTIAAHAGGFNTFTFGISMLGTFTDVAPSGAQWESVAQVAAWKLAGSYRDPFGTTRLVSAGGGTARWPAGTEVTLPVIFGHRDSGFTECPGNVAYAQLDTLRNRVSQLMADWRTSPINVKWQALGGDNWFAGGPYELETDLAPGGRVTTFLNGVVSLTWQSTAGAHWISGALRQRWTDAGGPGGALGFPTSDQGQTGGVVGEYVLFGPNKAILWGAQSGAHLVSDRFLAELRARGDVAVYGLPQTEALPVPGHAAETYQQFEQASIYSNGANTYTVGGIIRANWGRFGGSSGSLGLPTGNQFGSATQLYQHFQGGTISCTVSAGRSRCTQSSN